MRALAVYHFLTAEQLCRLLYSAGSLTYAKARLKRLTDIGFCERYDQPRRTRRGALPYVYRLSAKGIAFLEQELGLDDIPHVRPARVGGYSYLRYEHLRCLNDVLISVALLCHTTPGLVLQTLLHDEVLQRTPFRVPLADGTIVRVVPDAWVDLRLQRPDGVYQECYAIELDRGTERPAAWKRKVTGLVAWLSGPYQEQVGTEALAFAIVTTAGAHRLGQLVTWTEQELVTLGRQDLAERFYVTAHDAATTVPDTFFLTSIWQQPWAEQPKPLVTFGEGGA